MYPRRVAAELQSEQLAEKIQADEAGLNDGKDSGSLFTQRSRRECLTINPICPPVPVIEETVAQEEEIDSELALALELSRLDTINADEGKSK